MISEMRVHVRGFEGLYSVGRDGSVFSLTRNRVMSGSVNQKGYVAISLSNDGHRSTKYVHRLVADAFLDPPVEMLQVNHKDGNKLNNHVENLEWVTAEENNRHAREMGLIISPGEWSKAMFAAQRAKRAVSGDETKPDDQRVKELEAGLLPFACEPHADYEDDDNFGVYFRVGDIRRAAKLLDTKRGEGA